MTLSSSFSLEPSAPQKLKILSVDETSVTINWKKPTNMADVPHKFILTFSSNSCQTETITTEESIAWMSGLRPGNEYMVSLCTMLVCNGLTSAPVCIKIQTKPSPPVNLKVKEVKSRSVTLCWERPEDMEGVLYGYDITYNCDGEQPKSEMLESEASEVTLSDLKPGVQYSFTIVTVLQGEGRSSGSSAHVCTKPAPPVNLKVEEVKTTSVTLCWERPEDMEGVYYKYIISYSCGREQPESETHESHICSAVLSGLKPGVEYNVTVSTVLHDGAKINENSTHVLTLPSSPRNLKVKEVKSRSVTLCWERPEDMEGVFYGYDITYSCDGEQPKSEMVESEASEVTLSDLKPGVQYSFTIVTVLQGEGRSSGSSTHVCTKPSVPQKLKICTLDATSVSLSWEAPPDMEGVLHKYNVSWHTNNQPSQSIATKETSTKVDGLNPACDYFLSVRSVLDCNGLESDLLQTTVRTGK
ncbi:receptor-type tyrosine-protein phosphatase H-like [Arapaima gigas]